VEMPAAILKAAFCSAGVIWYHRICTDQWIIKIKATASMFFFMNKALNAWILRVKTEFMFSVCYKKREVLWKN
jgi:hypothetical protein